VEKPEGSLQRDSRDGNVTSARLLIGYGGMCLNMLTPFGCSADTGECWWGNSVIGN
jgi:hypothetical protein